MKPGEKCGLPRCYPLDVPDEDRVLRPAAGMVAITMVSRIAGWVRDKVLFYVLGANVLYDVFRTAFRIPNMFRMLLGEGSLHAALVPSLTRLNATDPDPAEARRLVRGVLAALLLILSVVVALGILAAPFLVAVFAPGFAATPGKTELAVLMTRLFFPFLALISLAALCQGVLNSHDRFLLPAAAPIAFSLSVVGVTWWFVRGSDNPATWLAVAVLSGGALQFLVQARAVMVLGYRLVPAWRGVFGERVRKVLTLMLPGIPVLGLNQLNQLVSNSFASLTGDGGVARTYAASRVTELIFGAVVVQLTTVLLPTLSRDVVGEPERARTTLLDTMCMVSFVTLPASAILAVLSSPVIGLLFGGGRFTAGDVAATGSTLTAYAFTLVGIGHAKVVASAFFAQHDTKAPMWGSFVSLAVFTLGCAVVAVPMGTPGIGWANTASMLLYAAFLTGLYQVKYGFGRVRQTLAALARQAVAAAAVAVALVAVRPWVADIGSTSLVGALRLAAVLLPAGALYVALVMAMGGREPGRLLAVVRHSAGRGGQA